MQPTELAISYHAILPETITAAAGVLMMILDALSARSDRRLSGGVALAALAASGAAVVSLWGRGGATYFSGMIINDEFRLSFAMIFLVVTFLTVLISLNWVKEEALPQGEYYALLMFATTGMLLMSAANDLVMIFLGLEITSISTYVLCGYRRRDTRSNEAAVKYFILGSFSTAFLLYGIALIYGASYSTGATPAATTNLQLLRDRIASGHLFSWPLLFTGAAMMIVGFGFKVSTAPFHVWSPDVYEGAPTPVTAFLSTGSKAAAFSAFSRVFILTFTAASIGLAANHREFPWPQRGSTLAGLQSDWVNALYLMAIMTMVVGNLAALS